ncbi:MAG: sulfatase [Candidatus Omnitrophota bacterium]
MKSTRRLFLKQASAFPAIFALNGWNRQAQSSQKMNVLWLIAEDMGLELGCYGDSLVQTPHLDRLASEGVKFTNAFSTAPVCSASRSAFMTGMYQTSIGAHNHRSHRRDGYRLPEGVQLLTDYFRDEGYFTANVKTAAPGVVGTQKTDFNFTVERPFDGTDWNQRQPRQPFFAQINFSEAHRNFKPVKENAVDPDKVVLPPYYPDHPIARQDWALYLDAISVLDQKIGAVLKRLDEEGLADRTIVVFMGDNGRCHVRGKQWLYDGGIRIPLIVRWPGQVQAGTERESMVSSIDISATCLTIAGVEIPLKMQGSPLFGPLAKEREYIVAARDRCDETVDRIRCVRTQRFKYIRNYFTEKPYSQLNRYKETQYPVMRLLRRLHDEGKLTPEQELFMAPTRPPEELYNLVDDPNELRNLAQNPAQSSTLKEMRETLDRWMRETGDQGGVPEDPAAIQEFEEQMKKTYYEKLKKIYAQEGMKWIW